MIKLMLSHKIKKVNNQEDPKKILMNLLKLLFLGLFGIFIFAFVSLKFKSYFAIFPTNDNIIIAQNEINNRNNYKSQIFVTIMPTLDPITIDQEKEEIKKLINEVYEKIKNNKTDEIQNYLSEDMPELASLSMINALPVFSMYKGNNNLISNITIEDINIISGTEAKGKVKIKLSGQEMLLRLSFQKLDNKWKISGFSY